MKQSSISSNPHERQISVECMEADGLVSELLASGSELTEHELFELLAFETTPVIKLAKVILSRVLTDDELRKLVILCIKRGCFDEIRDELPQTRWNRELIVSILIGALDNEWIDSKQMEWIIEFGKLLLEWKSAGPEDFIFVVQKIPALRDAAWDRLIALRAKGVDRSVTVDHFVHALAYLGSEVGRQKAAWILETWPSEAAGRLLGSADLEIALLAARRILERSEFNDDEVSRLICWTKFQGTGIPELAINLALSEPARAKNSISAIVFSDFATATQKEQAAVLLLGEEELRKTQLEGIVSHVPAHAATARARLDAMIALEEEQETPKQKVFNRLRVLEGLRFRHPM